MTTYILDKLLVTLSVFVGIGFIFYAATWYFYTPPFCASHFAFPVDCPAAVEQYWASLANPAFDWSSVFITAGLFIVVVELRAHLSIKHRQTSVECE